MDPSAARLQPGATLLGRFEVERPLAVRDTSETYFARDTATQEAAVLRVLWLRGTSSWKRALLLEREAAALQRLDHEAIPKVLSFGTEPPVDPLASAPPTDLCFVLAKSYFLGETLAERITTRPLSAAEAARVGAELCDVLAYLHTQSPPVVHRDLKPANVVLREGAAAAVIDFGAITDPLRADGGGSTLVGTHGFIAPEQVVGDAGPASDLYALGATLLACVTGRDPASLPREGLRIDVAKLVGAPALARCLSELTAPDPRDRPRSAQDAGRRLRAALPHLEARTGPALPPLPARGEGADDLEAQWIALRARWSDAAAHDAFIAFCAERERLPFAGQCYKDVLDAEPDDGPALRGKQRILAQALALLTTQNKVTRDWRRSAVVVRAITAIVLVAGSGLALFFLLTTSGNRPGC